MRLKLLVYTRGGDNRDTNPLKYNALAQVGRAVAFWSATWQGFESLRHCLAVYGDLCSRNRVNGTHRWWSDDAL